MRASRRRTSGWGPWKVTAGLVDSPQLCDVGPRRAIDEQRFWWFASPPAAGVRPRRRGVEGRPCVRAPDARRVDPARLLDERYGDRAARPPAPAMAFRRALDDLRRRLLVPLSRFRA